MTSIERSAIELVGKNQCNAYMRKSIVCQALVIGRITVLIACRNELPRDRNIQIIYQV